jgi:HSP20 family protein
MSFFNTTETPSNGSCAADGACATRRPHYDVNETESSFDLTVNLPGVAREGLEITDESGQLTIRGQRATLPEGQAVLHRETSDAAFELVLVHDNTVDASKIEAELKDGVLRLKLAKSESAKPRKISVS